MVFYRLENCLDLKKTKLSRLNCCRQGTKVWHLLKSESSTSTQLFTLVVSHTVLKWKMSSALNRCSYMKVLKGTNFHSGFLSLLPLFSLSLTLSFISLSYLVQSQQQHKTTIICKQTKKYGHSNSANNSLIQNLFQNFKMHKEYL